MGFYQNLSALASLRLCVKEFSDTFLDWDRKKERAAHSCFALEPGLAVVQVNDMLDDL